MIQPTQGGVPPWVMQYMQRAQAQQEMGNLESIARANLSRELSQGALQFGGRGARAAAEFVRPGALLAEDPRTVPAAFSKAAAMRAGKGFVGIPTPPKEIPGVVPPEPGMLSRVAGHVGTAAGALQLGISGYNVAQDPKAAFSQQVLPGGARERNQQRLLGAGEAALGGVSGAKVGALAGGTVGGPIGAAVGGVAGAVLGALGGVSKLFGKKGHSSKVYKTWYGPRTD